MSTRHYHNQISDLSFDQATEDFFLHQRAKGSMPGSVYQCRYAIGRLRTWLDKDVPLSDLTPAILRKFFVELQDSKSRYGKPMKIQAVHTVFCRIRTFFHWCESEDYLQVSPMRKLNPPRLDKDLLEALTPEEVGKVEKALQGSDMVSLRNRALVLCMLDSGMRLAEAENLRVQDIDLESGSVTVLLGKGRKSRMTRIGATALKALIRYLRLVRLQPEDYLWVSERGHLTRHGIRKVLDTLGAKTGIHIHPHKLRRTTALSMLRNGCDVFSLQSLMGHNDLKTLRKYLAQTQADIGLAHSKFGVLDSLARK